MAGDAYQQVLVGVWAAIRSRLDGTMLIIADDAEIGTVAIDAFLGELAVQDLPDARELSRFASGAAIVTFDATKKAAQRWPDVVLLVGDGAPSRTMTARIHAVAAHPALKGAALIGLGATSSSAVGLAAQSFRTAADWIARTDSNTGSLGRRLLRTLQARPRVAAAALLVAAGIGAVALVSTPESRVGASVEHAGLRFAISDTRTDPLPTGASADREDPDPGVDHHEILVRITNPGVETTGLDFATQTASDVFDLELADGTVITSEGARATEDRYGTTYLPLYDVEDDEFWVSFPIAVWGHNDRFQTADSPRTSGRLGSTNGCR